MIIGITSPLAVNIYIYNGVSLSLSHPGIYFKKYNGRPDPKLQIISDLGGNKNMKNSKCLIFTILF